MITKYINLVKYFMKQETNTWKFWSKNIPQSLLEKVDKNFTVSTFAQKFKKVECFCSFGFKVMFVVYTLVFHEDFSVSMPPHAESNHP